MLARETGEVGDFRIRPGRTGGRWMRKSFILLHDKSGLSDWQWVAREWRAGARIANMEFHPVSPDLFLQSGCDGPGGTLVLVSEAVRGEGGICGTERAGTSRRRSTSWIARTTGYCGESDRSRDQENGRGMCLSGCDAQTERFHEGAFSLHL